MPADDLTVHSGDDRGSSSIPNRPVDDAQAVSRALHDLTARFRLVLENASDVIVQYDAAGLVLWASPSLRSTFGYDDLAVVGTRLRFEPEDAGGAAETLVKIRMRDGFDVMDSGGRAICADGTLRWVTSRTRVIRRASGALDYFVVTIRDVTDQVEAESALSASEAHYRMLADNSTDVVLHTVATTELIDWASPSTSTILGYAPEELVGRRVSDLMHPEDHDEVRGVIGASLAAGLTTGRTEARFRKADGSWVWMSDSGRAVLADDGTPLGGIDSLRDITAEHEMREELERQARSDALTGLPNRRDLLARLDALLAHEPRAGTSAAVLFLDLDHLKDLNDTHGHRIGDAVLVEVGRRITATLRSDDVVGRIAGDEYVVLLPSLAAAEDAWHVADAIHERLATPVVVDDVRVRVSVSIGLTIARPGDRSEDVLHRADVALYRAKEAGRGRTEADVTEDPLPGSGDGNAVMPSPRESFTGTAPTVPHDA
jgi:diguanylate cyclase (GGDEF)-like protein/PAS domain S-box-containing protein